MTDRTFSPGPTLNTVRTEDGKVLIVPEGWILLPPGDAAVTRRVKAAGDYWAVQEKRGRKVFSRGIWAAAATVERIRADREVEQSTDGFIKKQASAARRREKVQAEYVEDFLGAVVAFLGFHPNYADLASRLAAAVTAHATPVGSGTVARTKRIPVEQRAEAAVIAWLRPSDDRLRRDGHPTGEGQALGRCDGSWPDAPKSYSASIGAANPLPSTVRSRRP